MSQRRKSYSAVIALLLLGILLAGSYALSMLVQGDAAYPVTMFGRAELNAEIVDAQNIRPTSLRPSVGALPRLLTIILPDDDAPARAPAAEDPARVYLRGPENRLLDAARAFNEDKEWDSSLPLYDALLAAHPTAADLALERARVLAWAGRSAAAGEALLQLARARADAVLAFEAAQNYWWAGRTIAADSALALVLSLRPDHPGAASLRGQVRAASAPPLTVARDWAVDGGLLEQLLYARALVGAGDFGAALAPYREAIAHGAKDSVHLELAAAANAADSADVAIAAMRTYLARNPAANETRIALARQYGWSELYDNAIAEYDRLIDAGHSEFAVERAQTLVWSGALTAGQQALETYIARDSSRADAWMLLGDVERWQGRPREALVAYRAAAALQPGDPALMMQISSAEGDLRAAQRALLPVSAARVRVEGARDTEGFSYLQTRAEQFIATGWGGFRLTALNTLPSRSTTAFTSSTTGFGGGANLVYRPLANVEIDAGASAQRFNDVATFLGWNASVTLQALAGTTFRAAAVREPAVRRTGSMLSLQARTVSERIELLASGRLGGWGWSAQAERERLASDLGNTTRSAAGAAASYALTERLTADARISALRADAASPTLPGFGSLYWSPERYVEPSAGLTYRTEVVPGLTLGASAAGGYAFTRERPGPDARFSGTGLPTFALRADAAYRTGAWGIVLDVGYGGAARRGYRSFNSVLGISYTLPR